MYNISEYETEHKLIWEEYKNKYASIISESTPHRSSTLIIDGAVNPEKYNGILFLLKEAYTDKKTEEWNICDWLRENVCYSMWNRVAEWSYGIQNTTTDLIPRFKELTEKEKLAAIEVIGLVNIKKINGNSSSSDSDLCDYVTENSTLLRREIEALQPRVIVCGYTGTYLKAIFDCDFNKGKRRCANLYYNVDLSNTLKAVTILDYYHPAAQYPALMSYYGITNIFQCSLKDKQN